MITHDKRWQHPDYQLGPVARRVLVTVKKKYHADTNCIEVIVMWRFTRKIICREFYCRVGGSTTE
jgi:hypothetical protein